MYTQKVAIIFDHTSLKAIMVLDHRRLIRQNFWRSTSLLYKILPTNLVACKPPLYIPFIPCIPFIVHHIWGETVLWGTVFIIQTSDRMQYFTILQYKLHSFNIQDHRSTRGLLAKPLKKFPESHIRPTGSHFCSASCSACFRMDILELSSNITKNLLRLFFI